MGRGRGPELEERDMGSLGPVTDNDDEATGNIDVRGAEALSVNELISVYKVRMTE